MATFQFLNDYRLFDFFKEADSITLFKNGKQKEFTPNTEEYKSLRGEFLDLIFNAYEVPNFAFADDSTIKADLQASYFIKFNFSQSITYCDVPFNALLIKIENEANNLDVYREENLSFGGRFFCLSTEKSTLSLYDIIDKMIL